MADTPTRTEMTAERLAQLRRQAPRGRDYYEAERARAMRDVPPHDPSAGDALNVLRYVLLDALDTQLPEVGVARLKAAVEAQVAQLLDRQSDWLFGRGNPLGELARAEALPALPPMLTAAEANARRLAARETP